MMLNPTIITTVRNILEIRTSAFADLEAGQWRNPDSTWIKDRIKDISYANRTIERLAAAHSLTPLDLIAACQGS
jgi:hypothetical protein